jgi:hypothetical protein
MHQPLDVAVAGGEVAPAMTTHQRVGAVGAVHRRRA